MFIDDTTLFIEFDDESEAVDLKNKDLDTISKWADRWLVKFCPSKAETLLISLKKKRTYCSCIFQKHSYKRSYLTQTPTYDLYQKPLLG